MEEPHGSAWSLLQHDLTRTLAAEVVFADLDRHLGGITTLFTALAFLVVLLALVERLRRAAGERLLEALAPPLLVVGLIAATPALQHGLLRFGTSVASATGADLPAVVQRVAQAGLEWIPAGSPQEDQFRVPDPQPPEGVFRRMFRLLQGVWGAVGRMARDLFTGVVAFGFGCLSLLAVLVCQGMDWARHFLIRAGGVFLPLFLAGLLWEPLRGQSNRFLLGLVGVSLWPVAWALSNTGTIALADALRHRLLAVVDTLRGTGDIPASVGPDGSFFYALPYLSFGQIAVIAVLLVLLQLWTVGGQLLGPVLIQRSLTSGANFAASVLAAGASVAASAAGAGAVPFPSGATGASEVGVTAGPAPSPLNPAAGSATALAVTCRVAPTPAGSEARWQEACISARATAAASVAPGAGPP